MKFTKLIRKYQYYSELTSYSVISAISPSAIIVKIPQSMSALSYREIHSVVIFYD